MFVPKCEPTFMTVRLRIERFFRCCNVEILLENRPCARVYASHRNYTYYLTACTVG